jgi:hypothetical protein
MGGGVGAVHKKRKKLSFFLTQKINQNGHQFKGRVVWTSGSMPFTLPNRLLTSLGVPFDGMKTDMA